MDTNPPTPPSHNTAPPPSINSGAVAQAEKNIKEMAREHTQLALDALKGVLEDKKASHMAKIQAATALLDRGHGKPTQYTENVTKVLTFQDLLDGIGEAEARYQAVVQQKASIEVVDVKAIPAPPLNLEDLL